MFLEYYKLIKIAGNQVDNFETSNIWLNDERCYENQDFIHVSFISINPVCAIQKQIYCVM